MLYVETLPDGRTYTYSDTFKIVQTDTGVIYDSAVDTVAHTYAESDIYFDDGADEGVTAEEAEEAYRKGVNRA